jgi:hypothetical protein
MMEFAKKPAKDQQKNQHANGQEGASSQPAESNVMISPPKTPPAQGPQ